MASEVNRKGWNRAYCPLVARRRTRPLQRFYFLVVCELEQGHNNLPACFLSMKVIRFCKNRFTEQIIHCNMNQKNHTHKHFFLELLLLLSLWEQIHLGARSRCRVLRRERGSVELLHLTTLWTVASCGLKPQWCNVYTIWEYFTPLSKRHLTCVYSIPKESLAAAAEQRQWLFCHPASGRGQSCRPRPPSVDWRSLRVRLVEIAKKALARCWNHFFRTGGQFISSLVLKLEYLFRLVEIVKLLIVFIIIL